MGLIVRSQGLFFIAKSRTQKKRGNRKTADKQIVESQKQKSLIYKHNYSNLRKKRNNEF
jgi:hypothetical protein